MNRKGSPTSTLDDEVLGHIRRAGGAGITSQQLALKLGLRDKGRRYQLFDALERLLDEGRVDSGRKGRYVAAGGRHGEEGTIDIIASGAGYVRLDASGMDDLFVPQRDTGTALHGDRVLVSARGGRGGRTEGKVLKVLQRRRTVSVSGW